VGQPVEVRVFSTAPFFIGTLPPIIQRRGTGPRKIFSITDPSGQNVKKKSLGRWPRAPRQAFPVENEPRTTAPDVLAVKQARDWASRKSGCNASSVERMVRTALRSNLDAEILLKIHPDRRNGKRGGVARSHFTRHRDDDRMTILRDKTNPLSLLETVDKVQVFSSMLGFEASMTGKKVHLFGRPAMAAGVSPWITRIIPSEPAIQASMKSCI